MNSCNPITEKWVIESIPLKSKGITRIDVRLPASANHCKGFLFTVSEGQGCFHSSILAEASLLFNNRKSHPLHYMVEWKNYRMRVKDLLVKLDEPILSGSRISGFIKNVQDNSLTLNLYLLLILQTQAD